MADEITEEDYETAKTELQAAITHFFHQVEPSAYVGSWLLITHKESVELARSNQSCVSVLGPTGQSFVTSRGMLEVARDGERLT
jgi:hypothetical protein